MNGVQASGGTDDINARYNTRMKGYTAPMSDIKELCETEY